MLKRLLNLVYFNLFITCVFVATAETNLSLEDYFKENNCIPEPSDDFFSRYLIKNEVENDIGSSTIKDLRNYRSEVNLLVQYNKIDFQYETVNEEGPIHKQIFNVSLQLGDETYFGSGKSKKDAKEMAAKQAIQNTNYRKPSKGIKDLDMNENSPPTVVLNNLGLRHGYEIHYYMVDPKLSKRLINLNLLKEKSMITNSSFWKISANLDEPPKSPFHVEVDVNGQGFYAKAHTIQTAKHEAAVKAIEYLKKQGFDKNSVCTMKGYEKECEQAKAKLKSPISILYEYAQKRRLSLEFKELDRSGPAHKLIFEMECRLGSENVVGKGKSKKEAKRIASQMMLEKIPDLDLSSDLEYGETSGSKKLKGKKKKNGLLGSLDDISAGFSNLFSSGDETVIDEGQSSESDNQNKKGKKKRQNRDTGSWSPMEKLVESGKALNLNLKFHSMKRNKSGFYSVLSMDLNPTYICFGIGSNVDISQEYAALNALKFLQKIDVLEGVEEEDLNIERFSFDNYIWLNKDHSKES